MSNYSVNNSSSVSKAPVVTKGATEEKKVAQGAGAKAEAHASIGKDKQSVADHEARYAGVAQPDSCFPPSPSLVEFPKLKLGAKGADVKILQELLQRMDPSLVADGQFGPKTEAAVRKYQEKTGLKLDGLAGQETHSALMFQNSMEDIQTLVKNPPDYKNAEAVAQWEDSYRTATAEAGGYLEGLRPESAAAKEKMMGELSVAVMNGDVIFSDMHPNVKPTVTPIKPPVGPKPERPQWTAEQIQSKVEAVSKGGMDLDELTQIVQDGTLDKMPREVKLAALERMTGDFSGWDSVAANAQWREAGAKLAVSLLRERPDAATAQAILDTMDKKYRDGFIQAAADSGIPMKSDLLQLLRSKVEGTGGDGIDADDLRNQLAKLQLLN